MLVSVSPTVAYRFSDSCSVGVGLDLDVGNNSVLFPSTTLPQYWKDTWTYGIAGDYDMGAHVFHLTYSYTFE
jgi:long-subunit fatty acid transport protein